MKNILLILLAVVAFSSCKKSDIQTIVTPTYSYRFYQLDTSNVFLSCGVIYSDTNIQKIIFNSISSEPDPNVKYMVFTSLNQTQFPVQALQAAPDTILSEFKNTRGFSIILLKITYLNWASASVDTVFNEYFTTDSLSHFITSVSL